MAHKNIWHGAVYSRGGSLTSKWKTKRKIPVTYRDKNTGVILTEQGAILGIESTHKHGWGADYKKRKGLKKPKGWHGETLRHSIAAQKGKR